MFYGHRLFPRPGKPTRWSVPIAFLVFPDALRERAYRLACRELPDVSMEDVLVRAERIVGWLKGEGRKPTR